MVGVVVFVIRVKKSFVNTSQYDHFVQIRLTVIYSSCDRCLNNTKPNKFHSLSISYYTFFRSKSLYFYSPNRCILYYISLVDFDQRYSANPTPTYPSDSVSVAKNSKDVTGKTKSARNFIHTLIR